MPDGNDTGKGILGNLWGVVAGFFEAQSAKIWSGFSETFWRILGESTDKTNTLLQGLESKFWLPIIRDWQTYGWIDAATAAELTKLTTLTFPANIACFSIIIIGMFSTVTKQLLYASTTDARRALFAKYRPEDIQGQTVIPATFIEPNSKQLVIDILTQNGYPQEQIDLLFIAMQRLYDEGTIRTLYFRGVLTEEQTDERLRNLGYGDTRIAELKQSWPALPSISDTLSMGIREAFSPEIIAKYDYAAEFPNDIMPYLTAQGLDEDLARRYWYAHWVLPSPQMAFDMLHRNIITMPELDDLLRIADYAPYWRDKLTAIAYTPFTRVDIRRMHQLKVLTDEELINAYMDIGYDETKAVKMAQFTLALNNEDKTNLSKAEILKGYSEGFISEQDATLMLQGLKFSDNEIDYLLSYEAYKNDKEMQGKQIKYIETRYKNNFIDEQQANDELTVLNLTANQITVLMNSWQLERIVDVKMPTKTEFDRFIKAKLITTQQYHDGLRNIGYSEQHTSYFMALLPTPKKE